jgi:hypothetical protein
MGREYGVSFVFNGCSEVMFLGLVYYLTIKSVAYILKFSLAAYFAISQYVFNYPAIGANHIIFAISTNLWQPYRFN